MKLPPYVDLGDFDEDRRIDVIGHRAIDHREKVGFIVEDEAKAERYLKKLRKKFPAIRVISQGRGPLPTTYMVTVGPPVQ